MIIKHVLQQGREFVWTEKSFELLEEEPLLIRIQGEAYAEVLRTPGDETALAAGFCMSEGLVSSPDDFLSLSFSMDSASSVDIELSRERAVYFNSLFPDKKNISLNHVCTGRRVISEYLKQKTVSAGKETCPDVATVIRCMNSISDYQPIRSKTGAVHGVVLFDSDGGPVSAAEDVGRHNAMDKAIGKLFLEKRLHEVSFAVISSRAGFEMVQKAARAGIRSVFALSRPTSLAVALAEELGMTLACRGEKNGLYVFTGDFRLRPIR